MDHDSLVALFRRIILASAPLLSSGCLGGSTNHTTGCPPDMQATLPVAFEPNDAGEDDGGIGGFCARALLRSGMPNVQIKQCELVTTDAGLFVNVVYAQYCLGGRRPEGLVARATRAGSSPIGDWLAATAHLEAASIDAFTILAAEIEAHRGPPALVRAAHAAARDERRHADVMARLAARHGATPATVKLTPGPIRDIESIARENAVEGCVRETFAALVACRQARAAGDAAIRTAMVGIARDETRHAALSWAVDDWSRSMLDPAARRRVREARRQAHDMLVGEQSRPSSSILRHQAGLPDEGEATRIAEMLRHQLS